MKLWSLDRVYQRSGGQRISWADLDEGLRPFHAIRERVGTKMELILDGHGFFSLPAALRIAQATRDLRLLWLEDIIRPDCIETIANFRNQAQVPIAVSEMLVSRDEYRQVLEHRAADYVMIDPTWVGGISETRRIAELAQIFNIPALMHDCTGPLTLFAGLHVAAACANVTLSGNGSCSSENALSLAHRRHRYRPVGPLALAISPRPGHSPPAATFHFRPSRLSDHPAQRLNRTVRRKSHFPEPRNPRIMSLASFPFFQAHLEGRCKSSKCPEKAGRITAPPGNAVSRR